MAKDGNSVRSAYLHSAILVPGAIETQTTLNQHHLPGIRMTWLPEGLVIDHKGIKAIVPHANVKVVILGEPDETKAKTTR